MKGLQWMEPDRRSRSRVYLHRMKVGDAFSSPSGERSKLEVRIRQLHKDRKIAYLPREEYELNDNGKEVTCTRIK